MAVPLITASIRRQVLLERLKSGEVKRLDKYMRQADKLLRERIGATEFQRRRIEKQLAGIAADLSAIWSGFQEDLFAGLDDIATHEAQAELRALGTVVETTIAAPVQVISAALSQPLSARGYGGGKLLKSFVKDWSERTTTRVTDVIRQGFFEGRTNSQILQTIRGTAANKYRDGLLNVISGGERALVRTAVQHMASQAREQVWAENADIIKSVQWVATLDAATCFPAGTGVLTPDGYRPIETLKEGDTVIGGSCAPRKVTATYARHADELLRLTLSNGKAVCCTPDHLFLTPDGWMQAGSMMAGQALEQSGSALVDAVTLVSVERMGSADVYDITVEHDHSFIVAGVVVHNCLQCAGLDGEEFPIGEGPRPEAHVSCRCVCTPTLDDDFAILSENAKRSSIDGPVDAKLDYYGWLKKQPDGFQDAAIGPERAQLLRDGGLSATRFRELSLNRNFEPMTLKEMQKAEPLAFERAGIK